MTPRQNAIQNAERHDYGRTNRRLMTRLFALVVVVFSTLIGVSLVNAQGTSPNVIRIGDSVTGTLNQTNYAAVYTFSATAGDSVTFAINSNGTLRFGLLITDPNGGVFQRSPTQNEASITLSNQQIVTSGNYTITILRGGETAGDFTLSVTAPGAAGTPTAGVTVTPTAQIATPVATQAPLVSLTQGMSVSLSWTTIDDLNLEVRDPVGGAINFRSPSTTTGGLSGNVNAACEAPTADNPTETVNFPSGDVAGGSYEIIVYYAQACAVPAQAVGFTLNITVNGVAQAPINVTLTQNAQYVTSFGLTAPNAVNVRSGGDPINATLNLAAFTADIQSALPVTPDTPVTGRITSDNPVDAYRFNGTSGQVVSVAMDAISGGSLDTFLLLLAPNGIGIASNDDADSTTRNSRIVSFRLPQDGQFTVLATRFGLGVGGTEGGYTLTVSGTTATTVQPTTQSTIAATAALSTAVTAAPNNATPNVAPTNATTQGTDQATAAATIASTVDPLATPDPSLQNLAAGSIQVVLTWDLQVDMRLLVRDVAGASIYTDNPSQRNSGILQEQGNLNCQNLTSLPRTYIYFPQTRPTAGTYEVQAWEQSPCNETIAPTFNLRVFVSGQEVINVTEQAEIADENGPAPHYVTSFTVGSNGEATAGEGQTFFADFLQDFGTPVDVEAELVNSTTLIAGTPVIFNIDQASPYQIYVFSANAGERIRLTMRNTRASLDPFLFLLDATGAQVTANDDIGGGDRNSRVEFTIAESGNYIVYATRYGGRTGGTVGRYELSLTIVNR